MGAQSGIPLRDDGLTQIRKTKACGFHFQVLEGMVLWYTQRMSF